MLSYRGVASSSLLPTMDERRLLHAMEWTLSATLLSLSLSGYIYILAIMGVHNLYWRPRGDSCGSPYPLPSWAERLSPLSLFPLSCLWSSSIKFSSDLDPIISSTNWFHSPVDLNVNFFSNLSYASCSNLNPIFLFLSFLTNKNCLFLFGRLPRCVWNSIYAFGCFFLIY